MNAGLTDGACAVCLAVSGTHLLVSNVGDSRAVLFERKEGKRGFEAIPLSVDHKPSRRDEKTRVEALGGCVTVNGVPRVNGILAGMNSSQLHLLVSLNGRVQWEVQWYAG